MDLSSNDARLALVRPWAEKYGIDVSLVCAVIEQESCWDPFAVRFERNFLQRYVKPADSAAPTTLELTRAMSFGLMQIMGLTAVELGWHGYYLTDLCNPDRGVDFGCRKLARCLGNHADVEAALLAYNGGGNALYGQQVLARLAHYPTDPTILKSAI